jgi:hypothetical protein
MLSDISSLRNTEYRQALDVMYSGLDNTRTTLPPGYPVDTTTNPNKYVARLNGGMAGPKIGPGIVLKVMAVDQFSVRASSFFPVFLVEEYSVAMPIPIISNALA